jgi:hypothetical protein
VSLYGAPVSCAVLFRSAVFERFVWFCCVHVTILLCLISLARYCQVLRGFGSSVVSCKSLSSFIIYYTKFSRIQCPRQVCMALLCPVKLVRFCCVRKLLHSLVVSWNLCWGVSRKTERFGCGLHRFVGFSNALRIGLTGSADCSSIILHYPFFTPLLAVCKEPSLGFASLEFVDRSASSTKPVLCFLKLCLLVHRSSDDLFSRCLLNQS